MRNIRQNRGVPEIEFLGKAGCHLCEKAREAIEAVRATHDFELTEVDISLDAALHARYGERIPVLVIDGVEAFELGVDPQALREHLDRVGP
jgi:hypothetical protein